MRNARWGDWRESGPFWGNFPLQQRRTETLEGEHFSYHFSVLKGQNDRIYFGQKNRFLTLLRQVPGHWADFGQKRYYYYGRGFPPLRDAHTTPSIPARGNNLSRRSRRSNVIDRNPPDGQKLAVEGSENRFLTKINSVILTLPRLKSYTKIPTLKSFRASLL